MIHWAQESFIQNPELVRMMFSLLHRQYDALGELIRALPKAYTINAVSVQDTMELLECLSQIRSLLIVQMGPEEERLMIQSIGSVRGPSPLQHCEGGGVPYGLQLQESQYHSIHFLEDGGFLSHGRSSMSCPFM